MFPDPNYSPRLEQVLMAECDWQCRPLIFFIAPGLWVPVEFRPEISRGFNLLVAQDASILRCKRGHQRTLDSVGDVLPPVRGITRFVHHAEIRHHAGAVFRIVANGARSEVEVIAELFFCILNVALRTIALEHGLAVGMGESQVLFARAGRIRLATSIHSETNVSRQK